MLRFLLLGVLLGCASAGFNWRGLFQDVMAKYRDIAGIPKSESVEQTNRRFEAFVKFAKRVIELNSDDSNTYDSENNMFSILTDEEKDSYLGYNATAMVPPEDQDEDMELVAREALAPSRDFSRKISPVKNQGGCGSCWTFGASAAVEGEIYFVTGREGVSVSEQEFMECSTTGDGCQGGVFYWSFDYIRKKDRVASPSSYKYTEKDVGYCRSSGKDNVLISTNTKGTGYKYIKGDDNLLKAANSHIVAVSISVVNSFYGYKNGIYNEMNCPSINHAVDVVGYGSDYWYVRNSWGKHWGMDGHLKMSRKINNICQISQQAGYPTMVCRDNSCRAPDISGNRADGDNSGGNGGGNGGNGGGNGGNNVALCDTRTIISDRCYSEATARSYCSNVPAAQCSLVKLGTNCFQASMGNDAWGSASRAVLRKTACNSGAELCEKTKNLGFFCYDEATAKSKCKDGECAIYKSGTCHQVTVDGSGNGMSVTFKVPCGGGGDGCDADAGLMMCSDCNCCKHKHMCPDYTG